MKQPDKIVIVNRHRDDTIGGSELQCHFIAERLSELGYHVSYVVPGGKGPYNRHYNVIPCLNNAENIANTVISAEPHIVYWRYNKIHFYKAVKKIKRNKIPIIFSASSVGDVNPGFLKHNVGLRKRVKLLARSYWNHRGFKHVDAVVVNNKSYLNLLPVVHQQFIPNGMMDDYTPFFWQKPYCAWISSIKQIERPEKLAELANEIPNTDFIMVGKVQEKEYNWIKEPNKLPDNVYYLGMETPEEVNGILKSAQLHVHTCYPEGLPNVFIQAWMQGTPSISLGFDPSDYITDNGLGKFTGDDLNQMIEYVKLYVENEGIRDEIGMKVKIFSEPIFNINKNVDILMALFQEIIHFNINYIN